MKKQLQVTKGPELEKIFIALRLSKEDREEKFSFKNGNVKYKDVPVRIWGIKYDISLPPDFRWVIYMEIPKSIAMGEADKSHYNLKRDSSYYLSVEYSEERRVSDIVEIEI
jgi:hypothetical protein